MRLKAKIFNINEYDMICGKMYNGIKYGLWVQQMGISLFTHKYINDKEANVYYFYSEKEIFIIAREEDKYRFDYSYDKTIKVTVYL